MNIATLKLCERKRNRRLRIYFVFFSLYFCLLTKVYSQNIGINTTGAAPKNEALLDIDANNLTGEKKGVLVPRMTTNERNILSSSGTVPESLLIYNTTTHCFEAWNQTSLAWIAFGCLNCNLPGPVVAYSPTSLSCNYFIANWSVSAGATAYYLDVSTSSTFASFGSIINNVNIGNVVSYIVSGLVPNTTYYYRVRAVNACGTSTNSNTITVATSSTCTAGCNTSQIESSYNTVETTLSGSNKTWITRNLGATTDAISVTSTVLSASGCYFQFNRSQAYSINNSFIASPIWPVDNVSNEQTDWLIANDPCRIQLGGLWRLPTSTEWTNVYLNDGWTNGSTAYASVLKLHFAGILSIVTSGTNSSNYLIGTQGTYWTSSASWKLELTGSTCAITSNGRANAMPVRCLK